MSVPRDHHHDPLRVVIAGGGVAGLEALIELRSLRVSRVDVTLISATPDFTYRALAVDEPFGLGEVSRFALDRVCTDHGARFVQDEVTCVHPDRHVVELRGGSDLEYDVLIVAVGARKVPAFEHGVSFDRDASAGDFDEVLRDLRDGIAPRVAIVVPDSVTWSLPAYELALLTRAWGESATATGGSVVIITHEPRPLAVFGAAVSAAVERMLDDGGVAIRCRVASVELLSATALRVDGTWIPVDRIVSLPHNVGPHVSGLPCDAGGFIPVDEYGRVPGLDDVYAAGDGTSMPVKQGGLAAQLADVVSRHIAAQLGTTSSPEPFRPVLRGLLHTPSGGRYVRAELDDPDGTSTISDQPLWWPPAKIASRSLSPYLARLDAEQKGASLPQPDAQPSDSAATSS